MTKFKVIEESRFLKNQEMKNAGGGACSPVTSICTITSPYDSKACPPWTTCGAQAIGEYDSSCGGINLSCPIGIKYHLADNCSIGATFPFVINCESNAPY